jgi:hypothetical protein
MKCPDRTDLQLIDGGYADASGIGTLAEIAPRLAALVREHNRMPAPGDPRTTVVPIMVYLEDQMRADLEARPPQLAPELFVPLVGSGAAAELTTSARWTQRVADEFADPCPVGAAPGNACRTAIAEMRKELPDGVVIVAPLTTPSVDAPLGWTLSEDSRNRLVSAMHHQITNCDPPRPGGFKACFRSLLAVMRAGRG